jgi:hypothetical protein
VERSRARRSSARHRHISARGGAARRGPDRRRCSAARIGPDQNETRPDQCSSDQCSADRLGAQTARSERGTARDSADRIGAARLAAEIARSEIGSAQNGSARSVVETRPARHGAVNPDRLEHGAEQTVADIAARVGTAAPARRGTVDAPEPRPEGFHEPFCRVAFVQKMYVD